MVIYNNEIKMQLLDLTKIKVLRKKAGFTQQQIAELLGINLSTYAKKERTGNFSKESLNRICEILEVDSSLFCKKTVSEPQTHKTPDIKTFDIKLNKMEEELIKIFRCLTSEEQYCLLKDLNFRIHIGGEIFQVSNKEKRIVELYRNLSNEKRIEFYNFLQSII